MKPESAKAALRRALRTARRAHSPTDHARLSRRAAIAIARLPAFKPGARVAVYHSFDGETDPAALISAARRRGVHLYVPVVIDLRHRRLRFHPLKGAMRAGAFGIAIPERTGPAIAPRWFDLIVVPLVGVDSEGRRLGMGGGFYDRALAYRRHRATWRGPRLVGLAFRAQAVATVHADPWDVQLDSLATESGLRHFKKEGR